MYVSTNLLAYCSVDVQFVKGVHQACHLARVRKGCVAWGDLGGVLLGFVLWACGSYSNFFGCPYSFNRLLKLTIKLSVKTYLSPAKIIV